MTSVRVDRPGTGLRSALCAAAVLLVVTLAGCGRVADVAVDPAPVVAGPVSGEATATSTATSTAGSTAGSTAEGTDPVGRLRAGLLSPADLGGAWTSGQPPLPDATTPAPCGGPSTVARFPDALRVGSTVVGPAGAVVQEALSVYADADTARAAFGAGAAGLGCGRGTLHGAVVAIGAPQDLRPDVGGDQASAWKVDSETIDAVLVLVQARQAVFAFAYVTPPGSPPEARPDPRALTRTAVTRALAA